MRWRCDDACRLRAPREHPGLASTAKTITCAALITVAVFSGFMFGQDPLAKMMGLGLATAIAFVGAHLSELRQCRSTELSQGGGARSSATARSYSIAAHTSSRVAPNIWALSVT